MGMLASILRDPVPYRAAVGLVASINLDRLNTIIGLLVGVATLVYLCLRIRREMANCSSTLNRRFGDSKMNNIR